MEKPAPIGLNDRLAESIGIELLEISEEHATGRLHLEDSCHASDTVHGGALLALAYAVLTAVSKAGGTRPVEASARVSFREAEACKTLLAQARRVFSDGKLARYSVTVTNEQGELLVTLEATANYRKEESTQPALPTRGEEVRRPRKRSVLPVQPYD